MKGVWHIFQDSRDEQEARDALEALKKVKIEPMAEGHLQSERCTK